MFPSLLLPSNPVHQDPRRCVLYGKACCLTTSKRITKCLAILHLRVTIYVSSTVGTRPQKLKVQAQWVFYVLIYARWIYSGFVVGFYPNTAYTTGLCSVDTSKLCVKWSFSGWICQNLMYNGFVLC